MNNNVSMEVLWSQNLKRMGVTRETYGSKVKDRCVHCGKYIEWDIERYERRGNFCQSCDAAINNTFKSQPWL